MPWTRDDVCAYAKLSATALDRVEEATEPVPAASATELGTVAPIGRPDAGETRVSLVLDVNGSPHRANDAPGAGGARAQTGTAGEPADSATVLATGPTGATGTPGAVARLDLLALRRQARELHGLVDGVVDGGFLGESPLRIADALLIVAAHAGELAAAAREAARAARGRPC